MVNLSLRAVEFLRESNAIEGITNIDYARPENAQAGSGHVGALLESQSMAAAHEPISSRAVCDWQRMICGEQKRHGHSMDAQGIGRLRGPDNPRDVKVATHVGAPFRDVPRLVDELLDMVEKALTPLAGSAKYVAIVQLMGDALQRFERIHPFVDGNGRTGRLLANYIATYCGIPIVVFRAEERQAFYAAHKSRVAMRSFLAEKVREAVYLPPSGAMFERVERSPFSDSYRGEDGANMVLEWHFLTDAVEDWCKEEQPPAYPVSNGGRKR